jgi:PAS domain S-box-containing protein
MKLKGGSQDTCTKIPASKIRARLKKMEINDSSECYAALFEQATDSISITDLKGNFQDVNSSLCLLIGYTKEKLLQLNVRDLLDPDELAILPIPFDLLVSGQNIRAEHKMVHRNGQIIYVEVNAKKVMDDRILVITRDITERKRTEQALQKSEANLRAILNTTDTIYIVLDTCFRIISYNPRAVDFARNELNRHIKSSEYFLDYFPPDKQQILRQYMEERLSGKNIKYEVSYPREDGPANWYHVRLFLISRGDTHVYGIMFAVSDITEKKLLENELVSQKVQEQKNIVRAVLNAQEIERNKMGQELHDNVNQILASARLYIDTVEREREPALLKDLISRAKNQIDMAIAEIRSLSRKQVVPQKGSDLKELIDELLIDLNSRTATRFRSDVATGLPVDEDLKLNIYRIVQEQINNILKHAGASEADIAISPVDKTILIMISDNGNGFNPLARRKGIGITNMINRVESYNGEVLIDSNPGEGCRIEVRIPAWLQ